ncbi:MAG TPA: AMP-dependent synthetase, partial [Acidimicrobiales bacterium]|nr:AMP-dependent synthetase [Acidimicrobiales bacterium]
GVAASCVVGMADERLGERVMAVVELDEGAAVDLDELRRHLSANLARYKLPEQIVVQRLPRNSMGKVSRRDLGRQFADESPA